MNDFLVGLQFLTRITFRKNLDWSEKACGGSVKFFPMIGTVLALFYLIIGYILFYLLPQLQIQVPGNLLAFILLASNIALTGALHCDGFCDTMDGILSGRTRDRILEIMKDSRVGAHGATSLILLLIGKFAMFSCLQPSYVLAALFFMPIVSRACMSIAVVKFSYARPEGMGKAFHQYSGEKDMAIALIYTLILIAILGAISIPLGILALASSIATMIVMYLFDSHVNGLIGGLTGDVYGATTELGEFVLLFFFVVFGLFLA